VHQATRIVTTESVNPRFGEVVARLRVRLPVEVVEADVFVPRTLQTDLRRFSRFWKKAEPYAFGTKKA
jgi:deoxyribodipyrimidine photo-lyase